MNVEERDPRLNTTHLEAVVKSWVEMGLAAKSPQALFAEEILRLRAKVTELELRVESANHVAEGAR